MSNGQGLNASLIILGSIAGAGVSVLMGAAVWSRFFPRTLPQEDNGFSQVQYMREVRLRYAEQMAGANGYGRRWREITDTGYA